MRLVNMADISINSKDRVQEEGFGIQVIGPFGRMQKPEC
jgi:hypothetical protein